MSGTHKRNTVSMHEAPRCGAKTRSGSSCRSPAVHGAQRCRMHGGKGSGAPVGNCNAQKHGRYGHEMNDRRRRVRGLLAKARQMLREAGG
ncbi:MAG: hypothetical protein EON93_14045 [Burkholderiales bacterium]|nr:MAG: hypothetical protein EON93_14045 [Burkholderiales bacterium]